MALTQTLPRPSQSVDLAPARRAPAWFAHPEGSSVPLAAWVIAVLAAVAGTSWSAWTHSMVLYGDASAHLDIARRITDGLPGGIAQIGSVWLPVPHLLLMPFVTINWLWHSAAAGAIVGGCCFIYSAIRVYSLAYDLTGTRGAAWCSFVVFVANLNILYLQSTALTEPVLLAFLIGGAYHMARWMRTGSVKSLAVAAFMTVLATMSRYEGWAFLVAGFAIVLVWTRSSSPKPKQVEANAVLFLVVGGYGIVLWVLYNLIIFHNALYFIDSSFSSANQQNKLVNVGLLVTKGHLIRSALTYGWTAGDVVGPIIFVLGTLSALAVLVMKRPGRRRQVAILALLGAPILFDVLSTVAGSERHSGAPGIAVRPVQRSLRHRGSTLHGHRPRLPGGLVAPGHTRDPGRRSHQRGRHGIDDPVDYRGRPHRYLQRVRRSSGADRRLPAAPLSGRRDPG